MWKVERFLGRDLAVIKCKKMNCDKTAISDFNNVFFSFFKCYTNRLLSTGSNRLFDIKHLTPTKNHNQYKGLV